MPFTVDDLNENNLPWRWRRIGEWVLDNDVDISGLNAFYQEILRKAGGSDYGTSRPPITNVSVASADASSVVFNLSSYDDDLPISFDVSKDVATYPNTNAVPSSAGTDISLTNGQWEDTSGPGAGEHGLYTFAATDDDGVEGPIASVEVVIAPAAATFTPGDDGEEGVDIAMTPASGAASETLYWLAYTPPASAPTAQEIIDGGESMAAADGITVPTGSGDFAMVIVSTNPGGSSVSDVQTVEVVAP